MNSHKIEGLLEIMARLRDRDDGCPWDIEQTFASIAPYTIEEAYEVAEAIEQGDLEALKDELGDLLLQVVFHARMAEEQKSFDFDDVIAAISYKMIRRHPHVFGDEQERDAATQTASWETQKAEERRAKANGAPVSALEGVTVGLPGLTRAMKLQKRAARVGFDWPEALQVLDKITEEIGELREVMESVVESSDPDAKTTRQARLADEFGDTLFALANLARHLKIDPEAALRGTNAKFERRFRWVEQRLAEEGVAPADAPLEVMERHWQQAKQTERS
ncbi:nucleoside triphosphate pyrophosphohydrolase [Denitrobaculum tricleocarpae]|uniref:Nucleoside triphosphate pyrophosphohydrolase n=1 Tax=Denitrobaculum tricleocarpae TaxID=2591009 RepID=A0A545TPV1_9PROT|nr:nucleoside triphosphate pyrophosphohydrolase [Denitrobaculum tricleocarpae]TQV79208.1 nucleoside triphosphate pyrophosphohydrolase [Denitrobaculum tricleocarpae]